jgi:hypothetical protein
MGASADREAEYVGIEGETLSGALKRLARARTNRYRPWWRWRSSLHHSRGFSPILGRSLGIIVWSAFVAAFDRLHDGRIFAYSTTSEWLLTALLRHSTRTERTTA